MPYFVYHVGPLGVLTRLAEFAAFREASALAKAQREARAQEPGARRVRIMFAENELAAEDLLSQVREPGPVGGDDE